MNECKDIDAALRQLNNRIDAQNRRLGDLERRQKDCCDKNKNPTNLDAIIKRLEALERYINKLDAAGKQIINLIPQFGGVVRVLIGLVVEGLLGLKLDVKDKR